MKKIVLVFMIIILANSMRSHAQAGRNCFNTQFHNDATSLDMTNAYLLGYLCTMDYAQYLRYLISDPAPAETDAKVKPLFRHDDQFLDQFKNLLMPYFTPAPLTLVANANTIANTNITSNNTNLLVQAGKPVEAPVTFRFIHKCMSNGYDPEALMISTPSTIYVVFRGTDRVDCANPSLFDFDYTWNEWLKTDFDFAKELGSFMSPGIQGSVHKGMMLSLMAQNFAGELASSVDSFLVNKSTGATKKVWITGHSLGGAHAQLFAMYLKYSKNITAQGIYLYESPHPGDQAFVTQLNNTIGKTHIQRFEFGDDPICTLPPMTFFFARAGERNFFTDYNSPAFRTEQNLADDAKIFCAMGNLPSEQIPLVPVAFVFPPGCPGSTCFHHPTFILQAIRHQLSSSQAAVMPAAVPLPVAGDNCTSGELTKAQNNVLNNAAIAAGNALAQIAWTAGSLLNNLIGSGFTEGNYRLACYGYKNNTKKYLNWNGSNNSQLTLSTSGTVFTINHKDLSLCQGAGGYQLFASNNNMAADVKFVAGLPTGQENTNNIIMKSKDNCIGDEETWYLFKVANASNTYVLYNWNSHKVLDAPDNCATAGSCPVEEAGGVSNDPTQVWILEKVN